MSKLYLYILLSDADDDLRFKTESESIANQRTLLYRFLKSRREFDKYERSLSMMGILERTETDLPLSA